MIIKDIVTKKTYTKDGVEKTQWLNIGSLKVTDDGKEYIDLNMFPNTPIYVFERKPKEEVKSNTPVVDDETGDEIPF